MTTEPNDESEEFPEPPQEGDGQDDGGDAPPPDDPDAVDEDPDGTL